MLEVHEQVQRIGGRCDEFAMVQVERPCFVVTRVDEERPHSDVFGYPDSSSDCVDE